MTALILLSEWQKSQIEFWRKTRFDGYDVSSFGRVRSWRTVARHAFGQGSVRARRKTPLILKPWVSKHGYAVIGLERSNKDSRGHGSYPTLHRLVAEAFIPNPKGLPCVNHLTGLKHDNRVGGLEWTTRAGNSKHAWATGLQKRDRFAVSRKMVAARKDYRDIPDVMIRAIRNMLKDGISQGQIRRWTGLKAITVQNIAVGRTYKDVA